MPNDAKLGLVVGVALVIAVAVMFDRKNGAPGSPAAIDKAAPVTPSLPQGKGPAVAKATGGRRHTVREGETLTGLARQYLGDVAKVAAIREMNPGLSESDEPGAGTVLTLPEGSAPGP